MLRFRRVRPPLAAMAVGVMLGSLLAVSTAGPATAQTPCGTDGAKQTGLSVDRPVLPTTGATTVTVTGANYLVPKTAWNAATNRCNDVRGGVYVLFGWVNPAGNWGPSTRHLAQGAGKFGTGYTYPGESGGAETSEVAADVPIRFVSFSSGGESGSSTPFHMDGAGNWSTQLVVNGATYSWSGEGVGSGSVDCRAVQCGIFTIGAHGITSRTNEVFTPIAFTAPAGVTTGGSGGSSASPAPAEAAGSDGSSGAAGSGGVTGGSAGAGDPATSGSPDGASNDVTSTTLAADTPVGANPSTTEAGSTGSKSTTVDGERASSVQDFGDDEGSSTAPLLGVLFGVLLAGGIVAVVLVRRRHKGAGRGEPSAPAAG